MPLDHVAPDLARMAGGEFLRDAEPYLDLVDVGVSTTSTGKSACLRWSTQPEQQPQLGSFVTTTFGRPSAALSGAAQANPASPATKPRRVHANALRMCLSLALSTATRSRR
jgi:hypothetical protein